MKKLTVLLSVLFAASQAYAGDVKSETKDTAKEVKAEAKDTAKDAKAEAKEAAKDAKAEVKEAKAELKAKTHEVEAEVVSIDSTKNTITIKSEKGESTAPLEGKAVVEAKTVKPGQKVTLVCLDDDKGGHKAVTEIKTPAAAKK